MFEEVSEDEVVFNGVTYKAEKMDGCYCEDCAFDCEDDNPCFSAKCYPAERKDGRYVIFVEKQP